MRLLRLKIIDFKGIHDAELKLGEENIVRITGPNGAGKSSIIDGAAALLLGKGVLDGDPIRNGAPRAELEGDLGELGHPEYKIKATLTRVEKADGPDEYNYYLHVYDSDGGKYKSPRDIISQLVGDLGYDVTEFLDAKPEDQLAMLQSLVPLTDGTGNPLDLEAWERKLAGLTQQRRDAGRDVKQLESQVAGCQWHDGVADEPVSSSAIADELQAATNEHNACQQQAADITAAGNKLIELSNKRQQRIEQIKALKEEVAVIEQQQGQLSQETETAKAEHAKRQKALPDLDEIKERLRSVEATNAKVQENQRVLDLKQQVAQAREQHGEFDTALTAHKQQRQDAIARAEYPAGVCLGEDSKGKPCVLFNNLPLSQCSQAEQLRVAAMVGMIGNPKLRLLMMRQASLLDEQSMAELERLAAEHGFQVLAEIVDTDSEHGVVIEDGRLRAATQELQQQSLELCADTDGGKQIV